MPNHVTNHIIANGPVLKHLAGNQERIVDFNAVIPTPDELFVDDVDILTVEIANAIMGKVDFMALAKNYDNPLDSFMAKAAPDRLLKGFSDGEFKEKMTDDNLVVLVALIKSIRDTGYAYWYEWNPVHWGTKWNAYSCENIDGGVKFDTAWSAPHPVLEELSIRYPHQIITHKWADEDTGNNVGYKIYQNGVSDFRELSDTNEGFELAFELCGDKDYYKLNPETGKYEYIDEEAA